MSCRGMGERKSERIAFMTYNRCYASQLEILEVIHLALWLKFGTLGSRTLPLRSATGTTLPLNVNVHFPRKRVHLMAAGTGENPSVLNIRWAEREAHLRRVIRSDNVICGLCSDAVRSGCVSMREREDNSPRILTKNCRMDCERSSSDNWQTGSTHCRHRDATPVAGTRVPRGLAVVGRRDGNLQDPEE